MVADVSEASSAVLAVFGVPSDLGGLSLAQLAVYGLLRPQWAPFGRTLGACGKPLEVSCRLLSRLGSLSCRLGSPLEALQAVLGASRGRPGPSKGPLGFSWASLGQYWWPLRLYWGPLWKGLGGLSGQSWEPVGNKGWAVAERAPIVDPSWRPQTVINCVLVCLCTSVSSDLGSNR